MNPPLRIVFAGTPDFAARPLRALIEHQWTPVAVFTQPDRPAGRGRRETLSPVKQVALDHDLPVYQPTSFNRQPDAVEALADLKPDLLIVIAYGLLLPESVLQIPRLGCVNVHASLLPRWRGAAPIQRAIEAGDAATGVTLMQMDAGLDTGPMISKRSLTLSDNMTGGDLHDALSDLGTEQLLAFLPEAEDALKHAEPQPDQGATYARKLDKSEARLDWQQPAEQLARQIRAFNPWPVSWFEYQGQPIRVWSATHRSPSAGKAPGTVDRSSESELAIATTDGWLIPTRVQPAGKKPMPIQDWLRGKGKAMRNGEVLN